jgi:hypothetical protein
MHIDIFDMSISHSLLFFFFLKKNHQYNIFSIQTQLKIHLKPHYPTHLDNEETIPMSL